MSSQLTGYALDQFALMDRQTGVSIYDVEHLKQSIIDILSTPIGSRVCRRGYGSNLYKLLDRNIDRYMKLKLINAVATSLGKWEPRLILDSVGIDKVVPSDGAVRITLAGYYVIDNKPVYLNDISLDFFVQNRHQLAPTAYVSE